MKHTVEFVAKANLPTSFGTFEVYAFKSSDEKEHIALMSGESEEVNVRIHSKCLTGDTFCSLRCDCRAQLEASLELIGKEGGVLIYLDQEGRGIGLSNKIKAYALQEHGRDTVDANIELGFDADLRDYSVAVGILKFLRIKKIRLITNNPNKMKGLEGDGIEIVERISLNTVPNKFNKNYLETKKKKLGHLD